MAFLQWRRFNFFDKESLKDESNETFDILKKCRVTCSASGRGQIILGDSDGNIHLLNRQLQHSSFVAFNVAVTHCHQVTSSAFLVTVGADEPGINPLIKIWNQEKTDASGTPHCSRVIRAVTGMTPVQVTAIDVLDNMMMLAVGFSDGSMMLVRGDITREKNSKTKVMRCSQHAITGMAFRNNSSQSNQKQIILFVTTTKEILSYNLTTKDKEMKINLDGFGSDVRCSCLKNDPKQSEALFIVGRKDAVYFYQPDERGPCLAFEGEKLLLYWFRNYLVVIGKETMNSAATSSEKPTVSPEGVNMNIITIYDISQKFIAYSSPVPVIAEVFGEWGSLYLLTHDGRLLLLREQDTQKKLETLFKKNQFSLAIDLAKSQQYNEDALADIFKHYGDHLYKKGDYDAAVSQYIQTIGTLEASYVIRKYLDAQRIHNLSAYLQALHRKGLATEDHTTLLLNCYAKLKDSSRLDEFIKSSDRVEYNVEIAIRVLRQAGYFDHAIYLSQKHKRYDWYFKIQLEDKLDANAALELMQKMKCTDLSEYMKRYGRLLMSEEPEKTTQLLKSLCVDYKSSDGSSSNFSQVSETPPNPVEFIHIFVKNSKKLVEFLEHVIKLKPDICSKEVYNTILELYLQEFNHEADQELRKAKENQILDLLKSASANYDVEQAMVLCQMNNFDAGLLFLYQRSKLFKQILKYHISKQDEDQVLKICYEYGNEDPNLWIDALWFFSTTDSNDKLVQVLNQIESRQLLPPIMIIDILASSGKATLTVIKDYLVRWLTKENEQISENEKLINQFKDDTERMRQQIEEMKTKPKIFHASKCCGCNHPLELPSVHFLCDHSYHQHCFESYAAENDSDCPLCLPENRKLLNLIRSQENAKDIQESFQKQLLEGDDAFTVIANYFSQGVFNKVTVVTDDGVLHSAGSAARTKADFAN